MDHSNPLNRRKPKWCRNRSEVFFNVVGCRHPQPEPTRHWAVQEVKVWPDGRVQAALLSPDEMEAWIIQQAAYLTKRGKPAKSQSETVP